MADVSELAILNCNQGCHNGAAGGGSSEPVSGMAAPTSLRAGAKQLSMYSELLANALQDRGSQDEGLRLEDLVDLARLQHQVLDLMHFSQGSTLNAFDGIASELEYDLALLRLCRVCEISFDVADFERPAAQRRRLEHALERSGISLMASN
jgi:hypothetical protein